MFSIWVDTVQLVYHSFQWSLAKHNIFLHRSQNILFYAGKTFSYYISSKQTLCNKAGFELTTLCLSDLEVVHCFKVHSINVTCCSFFWPKKGNRHQKKIVFKSTRKSNGFVKSNFQSKKIYGKPQGTIVYFPQAGGKLFFIRNKK